MVVDDNKINSLHIDEVADHLRELLQQECDTLLRDIEFLYECIEQENEYRANVKQNDREPSLNELKEERKLLEFDLMSSHSRNQIHISKLPSNVSSARSNRSIISPINSTPITPSPPTSASSSSAAFKSRSSSITSTSLLNVNEYNSSKVFVKTKHVSPARHQSKLEPASTAPKKNYVLARASPSVLVPEMLEKSRHLIANSNINQTKHLVRDSSKTPISTSLNKVGICTEPKKKGELKPRSDSVSSASSLSSSISLSRVSSVQKFRKMILEYRD